MTLTLNTAHSLRITKEDVANLLGLPSSGNKLVIPTSQRTLTLPTHSQLLQIQQVGSGMDFDRYFIMAACLTVLAPISKKDGDKKMWGYINDHPTQITIIDWAGFVFKRLCLGPLSWQSNISRTHASLTGCIFFLEVYYIMNTTIDG